MIGQALIPGAQLLTLIARQLAALFQQLITLLKQSLIG